VQPRIECIEDLDGSFECDAKILVALVAGYLRLMHLESLCQFALRYSLRDAEGNQQLAQSAEVFEFVKFTPFEPFVALDFFFQLKVERFHRIDDPLNLLLTEAGFL